MSIEFRDGMTVVEVEYPGTWIDGFDPERRFEFERQLRSLQNPLTEACVALDGFRAASEALVAIVERAAWLQQRHHSSCAFHARGFLYTFDRAGKLLVSLTQIDGVPSGVGEHVEAFYREFPDLRDVRNSSAHYEERMRGRNQRGEIQAAVWESPVVSAPPGVRVVTMEAMSTRGDFGSTLADGRDGRMKVTRRSLEVLYQVVQDVVNEFTWSGPPYPRRS